MTARFSFIQELRAVIDRTYRRVEPAADAMIPGGAIACLRTALLLRCVVYRRLAGGEDRAVSKRHGHEDSSRVPIRKRPTRYFHFVALLHGRGLPSAANQILRRIHFKVPQVGAAFCILYDHLEPAMGICPFELPHRTFDRDSFRSVNSRRSMVSKQGR